MKASIGKKTLSLAQFAMLLAIEALVCFTPLGSLPALGPIVATLGMVPVILTAVVMGTGAGTAMGAFAGLFSFLVWSFMPPNPLTAFLFTPFYSLGAVRGNFWSLVICFVPRILVGTVTGVTFRLFCRLNWPRGIVYGLSGALGSLTNTILVLGGIFAFFGPAYAKVLGQSMGALFGLLALTVLTSGIPEAVVGAVAAYAAGYPIRRYLLRLSE